MGRIVIALATLVLVLGGVPPAQAAQPSDVVLAVAGTNQIPYARTGDTAWQRLGGLTNSRPAVAVGDGVTHYFVIGLNGILYHRTAVSGWGRMAPDAFRCSDISALAFDGFVHLGCTGLNHALYTLKFGLEEISPFVTRYTKIGGMILGPATPFSSESLGVNWIALGAEYTVFYDAETDTEYVANTYVYDGDMGWFHYDTWCETPPAAAQTRFFAMVCGRADSGEPTIWVETYVPVKEFDHYALTGVDPVGGPALVSTSFGYSMVAYIQEKDGGVRAITVDPGYHFVVWERLPGVAMHGVAAAGWYANPWGLRTTAPGFSFAKDPADSLAGSRVQVGVR